MKPSTDAPVTIRTYESGDLDACRRLWVDLTERHRLIYDCPTIGGDDPGRQFDEHFERVGPENLWVAVDDGTVVGLSGIIPGDGDAELEPVIVTPSHRRRGIGRRLAEVAIERARALGATHFQVRPVARNEDAIRFFHGLGFDTLGHVELFMDFKPTNEGRWKPGPTMAEREMRH